MNEAPEPIDLEYAQKGTRRPRLPFAQRISFCVAIMGAVAFCLLMLTGYMLLSWYPSCGRLWPAFSWTFTLLLVTTVVGGVSGYRQLDKHKAARKPGLLVYLGFGSGTIIVLFLLLMIFVDPFYEMTFHETRRSHQLGMRRVCEANMRGIGHAIAIYQQNFGEAHGTFDELVRADLATRKQLICPSFRDNTNAYRFVKQCPPNKQGLVPIAIEDPRNHWCEGGNVLYDDFSVDFLRKPEFDALIQSATFE